MLAFITAAAVCLRWAPHHGVFVLLLFVLAVSTGVAIYLSQKIRYARSSSGITAGRIAADLPGVFGITVSTILLGVSGMYVIIFLV